jgi:hypothetical protein
MQGLDAAAIHEMKPAAVVAKAKARLAADSNSTETPSPVAMKG